MIKRHISIYIVVILIGGIYGCAQTNEYTRAAETEIMEIEHTEVDGEEVTDAEEVNKAMVEESHVQGKKETEPMTDVKDQKEQITDRSMLKEESEPEEEIEYDGLNTYLPILAEYERAWEDESYTVREWDKVSSTFSPVNGLGSRNSGYELYYSLADLTGDGTEELIIGLLWKDYDLFEYYLPYLIYAYNTEEKVVVEAEEVSFLNNVQIPRPIYENGIIEIYYSTVRSRNYRFYQLQKNSGASELIGEYTEIYYNESIDNDDEPAFYKGSEYSGKKITEEEYQDAINYYKSMPQIELSWHELDGFWEPEEEYSKHEGEVE